MATNFPTSQDSFTNPSSGSSLSSPSHSQQHSDVNDAVEAIELALLDGAPLHIDDANERVGIGTTSPQTPLHISQTGADALRIQKSNNDQQGSYISMWDDDTRIGYIGYAGNDDLYLENEASAGKTFLSTNGAVRLTVDSSGNVGINDTTPSYKLDVNGDINATGDVRTNGHPVGLVHIKTQNLASGAHTVTISNVFSSEFENYKIVANVISSTNAATEITVNGETGTTNYDCHAQYIYTYTGGGWNQSTRFSSNAWTVGWVNGSGGGHMEMNIFRPNQNNRIRYFSNFASYVSGFSSGATSTSSGNASTGFTLSFTGSTVTFGTGGVIRVYGYNDG